ncbi:MAG TPA: DUF1223 domain-containing protein [Opitutus sp.]|nr:DUF1223 domain-containing protein [Opitutus sp.]
MNRLLLWGALAGAAASACIGAPLHLQSGPARVSLIELYTSEGCSSCPPADRWLARLRDHAGLWREFVPLEFHVDYWNRLGWPDRFSTREFTAREYAYAGAWQGDSVYTPCFVRDGREWRDRGPPRPTGETAGMLVASYDGRTVSASFTPADQSAGGPFELHAALLGGGISSKVTAGENNGETLQHEFVALALAHGAADAALPLPRKHVAGVARYALAVWVTRRGELEPLQAAGGWLE